MTTQLFTNHIRSQGGAAVPLERFSSYHQWMEYLEAHKEKFNCRWRFEQSLSALDSSDLWLGWCGICQRHSSFALPSKVSGTPTNLREEMVCVHCSMNARVRAGLQIAKEYFDLSRSDFYITEQASRTYSWLQGQFPNVIGSEYVQDQSLLKKMQQYLVDLNGRGSIRFEDVTRLSFSNDSLDVIASFDVLEHVPDYGQALKEFARVLRPGGMLVLTAPFISSNERTIVRARLHAGNQIEHLQAPEYHGDPLASNGILCFYHFGWDLLDAARTSGFSNVSMVSPWVPYMGLMDHLWTLVAFK